MAKGRGRIGIPKSKCGLWKPKFLKKLAETGNVTIASRYAKVGNSQVYRSKESDQEFSDAWDEACEHAADLMEAEVARRAFKGVKKPIFQGGAKVGEITEYSDTLAMFLLKGIRPEKFRDNFRMDKLLNDLIVAQSQASKPGARKPKGT